MTLFLQLQDDPVGVVCDGQGQFSNTEVESPADTTKCSDEESRDKETGTILPHTGTVVRYPQITDKSPIRGNEVLLEENDTDTEEDDDDSISTESSDSSTPTMTDCPTDYDTDTTIYPDTDCEDIYGGQICQLSDLESEQGEVRKIDQNYYDVITE